jgi:hypothetical protein
MVTDGRLVISLRADRAYGMGALGPVSGPLD